MGKKAFEMTQYNLDLVDHKYGGEIIRQRGTDGYINATAMCRAAGKEWTRYRELKSTLAFFKALSADLGVEEERLAISNLGSPIEDRKNQGTWVHPQVAIDLAQWLSPEFKIKVTRWVFDWMSGRGPSVGRSTASIPDFARRFQLNQKQVPPGYFSVISELFVVIYAALEREGYVLPEKGSHGKTISPDVAVGQRFTTWLSSAYPEHSAKFCTYTHLFEDGRAISGVKAYENSLLGIFRDYVINVWMREHAGKYFDKVDPGAVPLIRAIVAQLPSREEYQRLAKAG